MTRGYESYNTNSLQHSCLEMQAVMKMADLTDFYQTGEFYANYIMG